jgi:hypothetical protein
MVVTVLFGIFRAAFGLILRPFRKHDESDVAIPEELRFENAVEATQEAINHSIPQALNQVTSQGLNQAPQIIGNAHIHTVVQEMALQAAQHAAVSISTATTTAVGAAATSAGIFGSVTGAIAGASTGIQVGVFTGIVAMVAISTSTGVVISNKRASTPVHSFDNSSAMRFPTASPSQLIPSTATIAVCSNTFERKRGQFAIDVPGLLVNSINAEDILFLETRIVKINNEVSGRCRDL